MKKLFFVSTFKFHAYRSLQLTWLQLAWNMKFKQKKLFDYNYIHNTPIFAEAVAPCF